MFTNFHKSTLFHARRKNSHNCHNTTRIIPAEKAVPSRKNGAPFATPITRLSFAPAIICLMDGGAV
jgi:hypothetical protein